MQYLDTIAFTLANFEGPLDFLWHLIQKKEIDIYSISLIDIVDQFLKGDFFSQIDFSAEFVGLIAHLQFYKSKMLLPKHEQEQFEEEEVDPKFEIIHQLIDYCRFKEKARELAEREQTQSALYFRGVEPIEEQKHLGIEHLCLDDLVLLFRQVLAKASVHQGKIYEENWKVSDKILAIRELFTTQNKIPFDVLFSIELCRPELIVTFLAVLELVKLGEVLMGKENNIIYLMQSYG